MTDAPGTTADFYNFIFEKFGDTEEKEEKLITPLPPAPLPTHTTFSCRGSLNSGLFGKGLK